MILFHIVKTQNIQYSSSEGSGEYPPPCFISLNIENSSYEGEEYYSLGYLLNKLHPRILQWKGVVFFEITKYFCKIFKTSNEGYQRSLTIICTDIFEDIWKISKKHL